MRSFVKNRNLIIYKGARQRQKQKVIGKSRSPKVNLEPNVVLFKHICSAKRSDLKHLLVHMMYSVFAHKTIRLVIYHHKAVEALLIPCPHSRIILIQLFVLHAPNTDIRIYRHKRICR